MKTRQTIAAMLLAAVGIWSCQQEAFQEEEKLEKDVKEGVVNEPASFKQMSVTALWQSNETRTSVYHDDDAGQYSFRWEPGDAISLVEVDPSVTDGSMAQTAQSNTLSEQCSTARFSLALEDRVAGDNLHYVAYYPVAAMPEGKAAGWDAAGSRVQLPLTLPLMQRPVANSFDGAADLLVSHQVDLNARPEDINLTFERVGTVLKLVVTGIKKGTQILGGTLDLGYDCGGEILYDAVEKSWSATATGKKIEFSYVEYNKKTGVIPETEVREPVVVGDDKSLTVWLRVLSGQANDWIKLSLDTVEDNEYGSSYRDIDLVHRKASINFREGGVTTFSVNLKNPDVVLSSLTSVPKLYIGAAFNDINSKTEWVTTTATFVNGNGTVLYEDGEASIRGRGNTTWTFPKKPYYLKLNKEKKKVNMFDKKAKSRKYILLANWMDRTNLRNAVAFEAARQSDKLWTPKGEFVDLYLNGVHKGLYYLVEKIEVENGRLSADYLFTMDMSDQSEWHFTVDYGYRPNPQYQPILLTQIPVEVKYPEAEDDETPEAFKARITGLAKPLIENFAQQVSAKNSAAVADLDSFCDWFLVHSLCVNLEPNHPKSCYMYYKKDEDGNRKMYAGPVWDFDWGTFVLGKTSGFLIENSLFYGKPEIYSGLFQDSAFVAKLKDRWEFLKPKFRTLGSFIDSQATWIAASEAINFGMWPIQNWTDPFTGTYHSVIYIANANGDTKLKDFTTAKERMKTSIEERITAIDNAINAL